MIPNQPPNPTGPRFHVYARFSDLYSSSNPEELWTGLQSAPLKDSIEALAWISSKLSADRSAEIHSQLISLFLRADVATRLAAVAPPPPAVPAVFHRLGNLLLIRNILLYRASGSEGAVTPSDLGQLALLQNDFIPISPNRQGPGSLEVIRAGIPVWDIYNPVETLSLGRIQEILTDMLSGSDPEIIRLRERIGFSAIKIDGLSLPEWVGVVFGLFAIGLKQANDQRAAAFQPQEVFKGFPRAQGLLQQFLKARVLTIAELGAILRGDQPNTRDQFLKDLYDPISVVSCLRVVRQQPFLSLGDRVVILDLQFLADLLTTGSYWIIFDSIDKQNRDSFREMWGRAFELYVSREFRAFYPLSSRMLSVDLPYKGGQVDAMLDIGPSVFVFEIKSSLLTEAAKRGADADTLANDIERKFIVNERGSPKAVLQLARVSKAVLAGDVVTSMPPKRVYPILITDEPGTECPGFNVYLNERFQQEVSGSPEIQPLTVISIDECEQFLPYAASNAISWQDLCETHIRTPFVSIGQTIYDMRQERGIAPQVSDLLRAKFEKVRDFIQIVFGVPSAP